MRTETKVDILLMLGAAMAFVGFWSFQPGGAAATGESVVVQGGSGNAVLAEMAPTLGTPRAEVRVPVLVYHHIRPETKGRRPAMRPYEITPEEFEAHMRLLKDEGFTTVGFRDLAAAFDGGPFPEKPVILTFDDGRGDQYAAWKTLHEFGFRATWFVFTNAIDRPDYLTWAQLAEMRDGGAEIESHTVYHPYLTKADDEVLRMEMVRSKEVLKERLGLEARVIAWPFGLSDERVIAAADAAGYDFGRGLRHSSVQRGDARMDVGAWIATGDLGALKQILLVP